MDITMRNKHKHRQRSSDENSSYDSRETRDSNDGNGKKPVRKQKQSFSRSSIERENKLHTREEGWNDTRKYDIEND